MMLIRCFALAASFEMREGATAVITQASLMCNSSSVFLRSKLSCRPTHTEFSIEYMVERYSGLEDRGKAVISTITHGEFMSVQRAGPHMITLLANTRAACTARLRESHCPEKSLLVGTTIVIVAEVITRVSEPRSVITGGVILRPINHPSTQPLGSTTIQRLDLVPLPPPID